jgi:hypothetical protein
LYVLALPGGLERRVPQVTRPLGDKRDLHHYSIDQKENDPMKSVLLRRIGYLQDAHFHRTPES